MAGLDRNPHDENATYWYSEFPDNYTGVPALNVQTMFSPFNLIGNASNQGNYQAQLQRDYGQPGFYANAAAVDNPNAARNARTIAAPWANANAGGTPALPASTVATGGSLWLPLIVIGILVLALTGSK